MASVPYPSFESSEPVGDPDRAAALAAVGRCRISPKLRDGAQYALIVSKNIEQARVDLDEAHKDDAARKKAKKKFMKEGVAMARRYLGEVAKLDASVVDVEVVLDGADLVATDGLLASCWLDAGCQSVVTDGTNVEALDAAKIPPDRLVGRFVYAKDGLFQAIDRAKSYSRSISVALPRQDDVSESTMMSIIESVNSEELEVVIEVPQAFCGEMPLDELSGLVGSVCLAGRDGRGTVCLVDPSASQLGMAYAACVATDRDDGLYATVVCTRNGEALGLVYSSRESIVASLASGRGVYYSRSRKGLWRKGDSSGHYQTLHRLDLDCDGDALRFTVTQRGDDIAAFCHLNTLTCWGIPRGVRLLEETLQDRLKSAPEGSYTKRLFDDEDLLRDKLVEEAQELSEAESREHVAEELADVLYFAMVRAVKAGVSIDDAVSELDRRARKVTRRQGDSKAFRIKAGKTILDKKPDAPEE